MRNYEITIIIPGSLAEKDLDKVVESVSGLLTKAGVKAAKDIKPKKQMLAYEIKDNREGYYVYLEAPLENTAVATLDNLLKNNDNVMRYLLVKKLT